MYSLVKCYTSDIFVKVPTSYNFKLFASPLIKKIEFWYFTIIILQ